MLVRVKHYFSRMITRTQEQLSRFFVYRMIKRIINQFIADNTMDQAATVALLWDSFDFPTSHGDLGNTWIYSPIGKCPADDIRCNIADISEFIGSSRAKSRQHCPLSGNRDFFRYFGSFWSGSSIFSAIPRKANRAWGIDQDRPYIKQKLIQLGMALGMGMLFLLSIGITFGIAFLGQSNNPIPSWIVIIGSGVAGMIVFFTIFLLMYKILPNRNIPWRMVWPGALLASVLLDISKSLFVWYLPNVADYNVVYGSFASIITILLAIYIVAFLILPGIEFNVALYKTRNDHSIPA